MAADMTKWRFNLDDSLQSAVCSLQCAVCSLQSAWMQWMCMCMSCICIYICMSCAYIYMNIDLHVDADRHKLKLALVQHLHCSRFLASLELELSFYEGCKTQASRTCTWQMTVSDARSQARRPCCLCVTCLQYP